VTRFKRTICGSLALLLALLSVFTLAPAKPGSAQGDPIRVVTTVGMIGDAVRNIGGDRVEVINLMGPGVDPHLYKPTAGDVSDLEDADMIFYGGLELEGRMTETFEMIARSGKPTVPVTEEIPVEYLRQPPEFKGKYDPHVWFDVTLWMWAVNTISKHLQAHSPDDAAMFQTNTDAYQAQIRQLDTYVRDQVARIPEQNRILVTAHDAFGYFGQQYGIEVHGLQGTSTATEASASDVQALTDLIVSRQVPAIFVESSVPPATIEAVREACRAQGWEVIIGEPLFSDAMGEDGTPEGTYIGMVTHNVDAIVSALSGGSASTPAS
jgi:manganese/zinc/iron transport system substrate-binding protein